MANDIMYEDTIGKRVLTTMKLDDGTYATVYKESNVPCSHSDFACTYHAAGFAQTGHAALKLYFLLALPLRKFIREAEEALR